MATIDLTPTRVDFILVRGDTWVVEFRFPDPTSEDGELLDLSGSTWNAQIREAAASGALEPNPSEAVLFADWDIDTSGQDSGVLTLRVEEDVTAQADVDKVYWYDLEQVKDSDTATPVQGRITVLPDVTVAGATP